MSAFSLLVFLECTFDRQAAASPLNVRPIVKRYVVSQLRQRQESQRRANSRTAIRNRAVVCRNSARQEYFFELIVRFKKPSWRTHFLAWQIHRARNVPGTLVHFSLAGKFIRPTQINSLRSPGFLHFQQARSQLASRLRHEFAWIWAYGTVKRFASIADPLFPKTFHHVHVIAPQIGQ